MTYITCRLTVKNRDPLRNPMLGYRVWATFTFFSYECDVLQWCPLRPIDSICYYHCLEAEREDKHIYSSWYFVYDRQLCTVICSCMWSLLEFACRLSVICVIMCLFRFSIFCVSFFTWNGWTDFISVEWLNDLGAIWALGCGCRTIRTMY